MKKKFANEKKDFMCAIIWVLMVCIFLLILSIMHIHIGFVGNFFVILSMAVPGLIANIRRNKQIKKIEAIRKALNLSIEDVRALGNIG